MPATITVVNGQTIIQAGENTAEAARQAGLAAASATAAALSEAVVEALSGPIYDSTALGIAGTVDGDFFPVKDDPSAGLVTIYENVSGVATSRYSLATTAALAASAGAGLVGWIRSATGAVARTIADWFEDRPSVMDFITFTERVKIRLGTSTTDVTAAFHAARDAVDGTGQDLLVPAGTYKVGEVILSGSNYSVTWNGPTLQQVAGLTGDAATHAIITLPQDTADVQFKGFLKLKGNIGDDVDEYSHGIAAFSTKNCTLCDVYGEDLRGDTLYVYGRNTSEAEYTRNLRTGVIRGNNVFRCIVAIAGGEVDIAGIIQDGAVGYRDLDIEPNAGGGYQPVQARIGDYRGSTIQITSGDTATINSSVHFGRFDWDASRILDSTPNYPSHPGSGAAALSIARVDTVTADSVRIRGYEDVPVYLFDNWKRVCLPLDFADSNTTETTYKTVVLQYGTAGDGVFESPSIVGVLADNNRMVLRSDVGVLRVDVGSWTVTGGLFGVNIQGRVGPVKADAGGAVGEVFFNGVAAMQFGHTTVTGAASAIGFASCNNLVFASLTADFGTVDYSSTSTNVFALGSGTIAGTAYSGFNVLASGAFANILAGQGAAIADAVNAAGVPTQAEFNALVTVVNTHLARARAGTPSIAT